MEKGVYKQFYELEKDQWWFAGMRLICRTVLERRLDGVGMGATGCLDVGCGTGLWTKELERFGPAWGLDSSPEALAFCRRRGMAKLVRASAGSLPFADATYGVITALGVIEHLDDDKGMLAELRRVCKPGGYVLFLTSAYQFLWSRHDEIVHHKRRYTNEQFRRLLEGAGFETVRSTYVNAVLFPLVLAVRLVQRLRGTAEVKQEGSPDVFMPPAIINRLLYLVLWAEAKLLRVMDFPFGVGLLALARKPSS
jgi:SAM-dependent methyltransferase